MTDLPQQERDGGWFKAYRNPDALRLLKRYPAAFILLYVIAHRARYSVKKFDPDGLTLGEAMLGDHDEYGMTRAQYRHALGLLVKWLFITIRTTNKGTIAKLVDSTFFNPLNVESDQQNNQQATTERPANNQQATTNEEGKKKKKAEDDSLSRSRVRNFPEGMRDATKRLTELMDRCQRVFGHDEMLRYHKRWLDRATLEPAKLDRVLNDTEETQKQQTVENPAAWAERMWREFK